MRSIMETTLSQDAIDRLLRSLFAKGQSPHTAKAYSGDLRSFLTDSQMKEVPMEEFELLAMEWLTQESSNRGTQDDQPQAD